MFTAPQPIPIEGERKGTSLPIRPRRRNDLAACRRSGGDNARKIRKRGFRLTLEEGADAQPPALTGGAFLPPAKRGARS